MKTKEEIIHSYISLDEPIIHSFPSILKAMDEYTSQQTEKYKELVKAMDELIHELYHDNIDWRKKVPELHDKISQLKKDLE